MYVIYWKYMEHNLALTSKVQNYKEYLLNPMYYHTASVIDYDCFANLIWHISFLFKKYDYFSLQICRTKSVP